MERNGSAPIVMKHPMIRALEALSERRDKVRSMCERLERRDTAKQLVDRLVCNGVCGSETANALLESWGGQEAVMQEAWEKLGEAARLILRTGLRLDMYWGQVDGGRFEIDVTRTARAVRVMLWTGKLPDDVVRAKRAHDRGYFEELERLQEAVAGVLSSR